MIISWEVLGMMPVPAAEAEASIAGAKMPFLAKLSLAAITAESVAFLSFKSPKILRLPKTLTSFSSGVIFEVFIPPWR
jgi:hypothetical protein